MTQSRAADGDAAKLLGTWKLVSYELETKRTGEKRAILGPSPVGYLVLLPEGRMMAVVTAGGRVPAETERDRAHAFLTTIAYSGRFRVDGDKWITTVDVSWNEAWVGTEQVRFFRIEDGLLVVMTDWRSSRFDANEIDRGILVWQRANSE